MISERKAEAIERDFDLDAAVEARDSTRWVWVGVIVLFVAMGAVLYRYSDVNPQVSVVRVRHILITFEANDPAQRGQALTRIRDIRERVLKGEDFGKLARDNSNDSMSAGKGGDLGYVSKGYLDELIDKFVWTAPIGQLSEVIQTKFGFHIVVVDDRQLSKADALNAQQRAQSGQGPAEIPAKP